MISQSTFGANLMVRERIWSLGMPDERRWLVLVTERANRISQSTFSVNLMLKERI